MIPHDPMIRDAIPDQFCTFYKFVKKGRGVKPMIKNEERGFLDNV